MAGFEKVFLFYFRGFFISWFLFCVYQKVRCRHSERLKQKAKDRQQKRQEEEKKRREEEKKRRKEKKRKEEKRQKELAQSTTVASSWSSDDDNTCCSGNSNEAYWRFYEGGNVVSKWSGDWW